MAEFLEDMRILARPLEMKTESTVDVAVAPVDFKRILRRFINNPRNQAMVYDVFHKFHRDRFLTKFQPQRVLSSLNPNG